MSWGALAEAITLGSSSTTAGIAAPFERPTHLARLVADSFGIDPQLLPVTRREAMSVPAMARARHLVVMPARLPLVTVTDSGAVNRYQLDQLIRQPETDRPRSATLTDTLDSLLFYGAAAWRVTERYAESAGGRPRHVKFLQLGRLTNDPQRGWLLDGSEPLPAADLIWFHGPHEGILAFAGRALRSAVRLAEAAHNAAANPVPAAELHQISDDVLTDHEIAELIAAWQQALAGSGVAYTNAAVELRTHGAPAENLLIEGRTAAAVDIARAVGLPSTMIDATAPGSSMTYQNAQAKARELIDFGLASYADPITSRLSMDDCLPRGVWCRFDWDDLTRADFAGRMAAYEVAQRSGVFSIDELRDRERGTPHEGVVT